MKRREGCSDLAKRPVDDTDAAADNDPNPKQQHFQSDLRAARSHKGDASADQRTARAMKDQPRPV